MGNAPSASRKKKTTTAAWAWDFKDGRAYMKRASSSSGRRPAAAKRPLFKKQPSNNYNWWIGNPEPRNRR